MTDKAVSPLRRRLIEDVAIRRGSVREVLQKPLRLMVMVCG